MASRSAKSVGLCKFRSNTTMEPLHELKVLVKLCEKRPASNVFPQQANGPLIDRVTHWIETHSELPDTKPYREGIQKLREFLLLHKAATQGPVPKTETKFYIVIDTSVFFHREDILDHLSENCILVLPQAVKDELKNRARSRNVHGKKARRIMEQIRSFPENRLVYLSVGIAEFRQLFGAFPVRSLNDRCDHRILAAAKRLATEKKPTRLISDDNEMREKAAELGIPALSLREFLADW